MSTQIGTNIFLFLTQIRTNMLYVSPAVQKITFASSHGQMKGQMKYECCAANYLQLLKSDYPQLNKEKSVGLFKI